MIIVIASYKLRKFSILSPLLLQHYNIGIILYTHSGIQHSSKHYLQLYTYRFSKTYYEIIRQSIFQISFLSQWVVLLLQAS